LTNGPSISDDPPPDERERSVSNVTPISDGHRGRSRRSTGPPHRRLNHYAWLDVIREHRVLPVDQALLAHFVLMADWRSWEYAGSYDGISKATRLSRNTAPKSVERLRTSGLVRVVSAFGPRTEGVVEVLCYGRLIVDAPPHETPQNCAVSGDESESETAQQSRSNRAVIAQSCAIDQGKQAVPKQVRKEGGYAGSARDVVVSDEALAKRLAEAFPGAVEVGAEGEGGSAKNSGAAAVFDDRDDDWDGRPF
jgi:hypothetical protein